MFAYRLMSHVADVNTQSSVSKFHYIMSFITLHIFLYQVFLYHFILFIFHNCRQNWMFDSNGDNKMLFFQKN